MATVANTTTSILDKILARGLMALRETAVMPQLVNSDWSSEAAKKGDVINVPLSRAKSATAVTAAETPIAPTASVQDVVQIPLDQWYQVDMHMSDKDMAEVDKDAHFLPMEMAEAMRALANQVNTNVMSKILQIGNAVETDGATPFVDAGSSLADMANIRKRLRETLCPVGTGAPLRFVTDLAAEALLLQQATFYDASITGKQAPLIDGSVGRFMGFDFFAEDALSTFTPGTGDSYVVNNGNIAVGSTALTIDGGTGTFVAGDVITFGNGTESYAVTADVASVAAAVVIQAPGLRDAIVDGETITIKGNDSAAVSNNVAFHRDCIAFASRSLSDSNMPGANIRSMTDPVTGLTLRLEILREYKQWVWDFDMLWGARVVRPEYGCRLLNSAA